MGIARKLALVAVTLVTVMALNASSASAIEVIEEPPGQAGNGPHCTTTITEEFPSMCNLTAATVGKLEVGGALGFMVSCDVSLLVVMSEAGVVISPNYDISEASCGGGILHECVTTGRRHPQANPTADPGTFPIPIEFDICVDMEAPINVGELQCHVAGALTRTGTSGHQYQIDLTHSNICELPLGISLQTTIRTPVSSGVEIIP
jgi:hypothetical protein